MVCGLVNIMLTLKHHHPVPSPISSSGGTKRCAISGAAVASAASRKDRTRRSVSRFTLRSSRTLEKFITWKKGRKALEI